MRIMSLGHAYTHLNFKAKLAYKKQKAKTTKKPPMAKEPTPGGASPEVATEACAPRAPMKQRTVLVLNLGGFALYFCY